MEETNVLERYAVAYDGSEGDKFKMANGKKTYTQQYSHVYNNRMLANRKALSRTAEERWPGVPVVERIVSACDAAEGERVAIVGMSFKEIAERPNILDEYRLEYGFDGPKALRACYASECDAIVLEDESGRVRLVDGAMPVPVAMLTSGLPMAALGTLNEAGELLLIDWCGAGLAEPCEHESPPCERGPGEPNARVLLMSGLESGLPSECAEGEARGAFALLTEWLAGALSDGDENASVVRSICKCVVAGDIVAESSTASPAVKGRVSAAERDALVAPLRAADVALGRLAALLPTDAMPGGRDPSNSTLPQQPLHALLLPHASRYRKTFRAVSIRGVL